MAKYSQTTRNSDGNYETRVHTDYTQTAAEGAGRAAGVGLALIFELIFMSKLTVGITLLIIALFTLGPAPGWGFFFLILGGGFVVWWWNQRQAAIAEEERIARNEQLRVENALRKSQQLAASHSTPPPEPVVTLVGGEKELTRFWTLDGGKGVLTTRRLVIDQASGSMSVITVADIKGVSGSSESVYDATIHLPTASGKHSIRFSSRTESERVMNALRSAVLGTT